MTEETAIEIPELPSKSAIDPRQFEFYNRECDTIIQNVGRKQTVAKAWKWILFTIGIALNVASVCVSGAGGIQALLGASTVYIITLAVNCTIIFRDLITSKFNPDVVIGECSSILSDVKKLQADLLGSLNNPTKYESICYGIRKHIGAEDQ
jgi:hypothetical protein